MALIPDNCKILENEVDGLMNNIADGQATWRHLVAIDYAFNHNQNDYDDGLSFLDRLHRKLGQFHNEWNIEQMKNDIRNANQPMDRYKEVIELMLADPRDIAYYGL